VAVAVSITLDAGDTCKEARVVLGNAAPTSIRAKKAESVLVGKKLTDALFEKAAKRHQRNVSLSAIFTHLKNTRRHLVGVLTKRMAKAAFEQAKKIG